MTSALILLFSTIVLTAKIQPAHAAGVAPSCTYHDRCQVQLSPDLTMRYRIHFPDDYQNEFDSNGDNVVCAACKMSVQLTYEGYTSWLGIGTSFKGKMVDSDVVIGQPGVHEPQFFYLGAKDVESVTPNPQMQLEDTSVEYIDDMTIMEFSTSFANLGIQTPIRASLNNLYTFIWAHGNGQGEEKLGYHGPGNKSSHTVEDLLGFTQKSPVMTLQQGSNKNKIVWLVHGLMAWVAFGIFVPLAVTTAIYRDFDSSAMHILPKFWQNLANEISKRWLQIHVGLNTLTCTLTLFVFAVAVLTIRGEGSSHWKYGHSKMGLALFILVSAQVLGGYFRPKNSHDNATADDHNREGREEEEMTNENNNKVGEVKGMPEKSALRQIWELMHQLIGIALFLFGMWQMNEGIALYHTRYGLSTSTFVAIATLYLVWMSLWASVILGGIAYKLLFRDQSLESEEGESALETVQPGDGAASETELT